MAENMEVNVIRYAEFVELRFDMKPKIEGTLAYAYYMALTHFQSNPANKKYTAANFIAAKLGIKPSTLYSIIDEDRTFNSPEAEERFFVECDYVEEGYALKAKAVLAKYGIKEIK